MEYTAPQTVRGLTLVTGGGGRGGGRGGGPSNQELEASDDGQYKDTVGTLMGKRGLQYVITDSWEAGVQNWTDDMIAEFAKHRGYVMRPWLPVLAGRIVESAEASDRFLWDFRKTIADLTAENHNDQLTAILRERDMGPYMESHENGRAFIADGLDVKRNADVPMSAMWTAGPNQTTERCAADMANSILICMRKVLAVSPVGLPLRSK